MTAKEIRLITRLSQADFSSKYNIPKRTLEKWEQGTNICPEYVLELLEYKVKNENVFCVNGTEYNINQVAIYMNDEIREELHYHIIPCGAQDFWSEYCRRDKHAEEILNLV